VSEPQLLLLEKTHPRSSCCCSSPRFPIVNKKKKSQTPRRVGDQHIQYFHSQ
jgi:hypothetical protein